MVAAIQRSSAMTADRSTTGPVLVHLPGESHRRSRGGGSAYPWADLSLATVLGALCILGAYAVVCWGLDVVRWVLA